MQHSISKGFSPDEANTIAQLYWQAFGMKLRVPMGPTDKALAFIAEALNPDFALVARDPSSTILGVAGFKTDQGALIGGGLRDLARTYGWLSTLWRAPLLALVERDQTEDTLLMDGICVADTERGQGLGTALLHAIMAEAKSQGRAHVRLDVINTNPRARALYERMGFVPSGEEHLGPLSKVFGFQSSTKLIWTSPNR